VSAEPKPEGLTDEEVDAITLTIDTEEPTLNVAPLLKAVTRIVAAREVAAEQAGREDNALHDMCYVSGSKALEAREAAARREALLEAADLLWPPRYVPGMDDFIGCRGREYADDYAAWLRARAEEQSAALAEPGRDEEGGRND
jgi:hypothetical protein